MQKFVALACLCLAATVGAAQAAPEIGLRGDKVVVKIKGKNKALPADDFPLQAVRNADGDDADGLRYVAIGAEGGAPFGLEAGLYLFDEAGGLAAFVPTDAAEFSAEVRRSPYGRVLAMDSGTGFERAWTFFAYPDLAPLAEIGYVLGDDAHPPIAWDDDGGALVTTIRSTDQPRQCDYESCGPKSVTFVPFDGGDAWTVISGTDLCDYELVGYSSGRRQAQVDKLCLPSVEAWRELPEDAPRRTIRVRLPAAG